MTMWSNWRWMLGGLIWQDIIDPRNWEESSAEGPCDELWETEPDGRLATSSALNQGANTVRLPVERLEDTERELKVQLVGITAELLDDGTNTALVRGELRLAAPRLAETVCLSAVAFNETAEVIGVVTDYIEPASSSVARPFQLEVVCSHSHGQPARVRVYVHRM